MVTLSPVIVQIIWLIPCWAFDSGSRLDSQGRQKPCLWGHSPASDPGIKLRRPSHRVTFSMRQVGANRKSPNAAHRETPSQRLSRSISANLWHWSGHLRTLDTVQDTKEEDYLTLRSVGIPWSSFLNLSLDSSLSMPHNWAAPALPIMEKNHPGNYSHQQHSNQDDA